MIYRFSNYFTASASTGLSDLFLITDDLDITIVGFVSELRGESLFLADQDKP